MSYRTQALMAQDRKLLERVAACAAQEGDLSPLSWAAAHIWQLSGSPGWDEAYEYALAQGVESPGYDEAVITDGAILAAVQRIRASG